MLSKLGRLVDDYWHLVAVPAGGALLAWAGILIADRQSTFGYLILVLGATLSIIGALAGARVAQTNTKLQETLRTVRTEVAASKAQRIFLVVSGFREEWQIELNFHLLRLLRQSDLHCDIFCPLEDTSLAEQRIIRRDLLNNVGSYRGGLMISPIFPDRQMHEVNDFARRLALPLVFIDQNPPMDRDQMPQNISWVSVSDSQGGKLAADAAHALAQKRPVRRVLVVAGPAKHQRQEVFRREFLNYSPDCEMFITEDGGFKRQLAENLVHGEILDAISSKRPYDLVFCTADSMTLGCLDALARVNWRNKKPPEVIGYDGVPLVQHLIQRGDTLLRRVVIQDPEQLASAAVSQLMQMSAGDAPGDVVWIEPYLYPRHPHLTPGHKDR